MVTKTLPTRAEIPADYKWNLEAIYPEDPQWEADFVAIGPLLERASAYAGYLGDSAQTLLSALTLRDDINERLERLFSYARMRRDEDNTDPRYQALADRAAVLATRADEILSFIDPELLQVGPENVEEFSKESDALKIYGHQFDDLFREKDHLLSEAEEALLAGVSDIAGGPGQIFDMLTDADMKYGVIIDEDGQEVELTQGRYLKYLLSPDRRVRADTLFTFHRAFEAQKNTIAACYSTHVKSDIFYARARKYGSCLEASLFRDNVPVSVYEGLIEAVHQNLPVFDRYLSLRRRVLDLERLHMYDLHVPLIPEVNQTIPYDRATELVTEAVRPMGDAYVSAVKEGFASRWTDVYETPNKSSGAYSWGVYGVQPFMLLNYQETLRDAFTVAHETGHSIHTYYSYHAQPYLYAHYTLFVAEVASTLNEELLIYHMLNNTDDQMLRLAVVNHSLEQFRTTIYRQTMFAEFEKLAHERAEAGEALTAEALSEIHYDLNVKYHGENVYVDPEIAIEWARIPHFYRSFYVYKYATGMSAAVALSQQILDEGEPAVERYLRFLSRGGSDYSINLLKDAGIDMTSPEPVNQALRLFARRVGEMEELLGLNPQ